MFDDIEPIKYQDWILMKEYWKGFKVFIKTWKKTSWNRQQCSPIHWDYRYYKINIYVKENP